jgi:hypothetical protein
LRGAAKLFKEALMARKAVLATLIVSLVLAVPAVAQQGNGTWTTGPGMMGGFGGPGMMRGGFGMMGGGFGMMSQYPDGYVAFLKTELGITAAQEKVWAPCAKAIRDGAAANAKLWGPGGRMGPQGRQMGPGMMQNYQAWQPQPLPDALDRQVDWAQSRLDSLKALRDAAKPLYAKLSDEQKAKADRLLGAWY